MSRIAERTGEAAAKVLAETDYIERSVSMIREERAYLAGELAGCVENEHVTQEEIMYLATGVK